MVAVSVAAAVSETEEMKVADSVSPRRVRSEGMEVRKETISERGRKPQKPSKAVTAIAISGLWLSSGWVS